MKSEQVDVLVVGAGPAGLVAACLLSRAGLKTLVLERNADFAREFRGEVLQPRFHKAMRDVGLFDRLAAAPHEEVEGAHIFFEGRPLGAVALNRLDRQSGTTWWMTQPVLLQALREDGERNPGFELRFHAAVHRVEGSTVWTKGAGGEEGPAIEAKVILAADGRFSTVRRLVGFENRYDHHDLDVIWFLLPRPADYTHFFGFFLTAGHNYLIFPKHPNKLQCGLVMRPGEFHAFRERGLEAVREELRRAHPVFADFAAGLRDFTPFQLLQGNTALVDEWARDGLVLIGDAAHTCSPVGGIGVAVAVETACVAADVVLGCFEADDFSRERLGAIQALREKEVRRVHFLQGRAGKLIVRAPAFVRRAATLFIMAATRTGILPVIARQLLTQRRHLPLERLGRD